MREETYPALAMTLIKTCSLMENGPGLKLHVFPNVLNFLVGSDDARRIPSGYERIVANIESTPNALVRKNKIELLVPKAMHQKQPSSKTRKLRKDLGQRGDA